MGKTAITVAYGDGIGPEIMDASLRILQGVGAQIDIEEVVVGEGVGPGSPLDKIRSKTEGKVVLYGVGLESMTLIHLAENRAPAPYVGVPFRGDRPNSVPVMVDGKTVKISLAENPGCSQGFGSGEKPLREAGLISETRIGAARVRAIPAGAAVDALIKAIRQDGTFLLAPPAHCYFCRHAHRRAHSSDSSVCQ